MNNINLYKKTRDEIEYKRQRAKEGKLNALPYQFEKLSRIVPGIMPELFVASTSVSGGGKTIIDQELHLHGPYNFWKKNKDKMDFDISIHYFPLEDSVELTHKRFIIKQLYNQFGDRVGMFNLDSLLQGSVLSDDIMRKIDSLEPHFDEFYSKVRLIDSVTNATGIYKKVRDWLLLPENGYIADSYGNKLNEEQIKYHNENHLETTYKRTNPNRIDIISIDNMSNITPEGTLNRWDSIDLLVRVYLRKKLVNYFKCFCSIICQQEKSKEKSQYTGNGEVIAEKFVPSLDSVALYKNIDTAVHLFFSIFDPSRYSIPSWHANGSGYYNIDRFGCHYRNISILKSNFAQVGISNSIFFDGVSGYMHELPKADEVDAMEYWYNRAEGLRLTSKGIKPTNMTQ